MRGIHRSWVVGDLMFIWRHCYDILSITIFWDLNYLYFVSSIIIVINKLIASLYQSHSMIYRSIKRTGRNTDVPRIGLWSKYSLFICNLVIIHVIYPSHKREVMACMGIRFLLGFNYPLSGKASYNINSSPLGQNGPHFADDIFTWIYVNENIFILIKNITEVCS